MHAKVTTHVLLGGKSHRLPLPETVKVLSDQSGEQTGSPEHKEMAAAAKFAPLRSRFSQEHSAHRRGKGPGIAGKILGDIVGMIP